MPSNGKIVINHEPVPKPSSRSSNIAILNTSSACKYCSSYPTEDGVLEHKSMSVSLAVKQLEVQEVDDDLWWGMPWSLPKQWDWCCRVPGGGSFHNGEKWELLCLPGEFKDGGWEVSSLEKLWNSIINMGVTSSESSQGSRKVWGSGNHPDWFQVLKCCTLLPRGHINTELETVSMSNLLVCQILDGSAGKKYHQLSSPSLLNSLCSLVFTQGIWFCGGKKRFQNACMMVYLHTNVILQLVASLGRPLEVHWNVFIKKSNCFQSRLEKNHLGSVKAYCGQTTHVCFVLRWECSSTQPLPSMHTALGSIHSYRGFKLITGLKVILDIRGLIFLVYLFFPNFFHCSWGFWILK